MRLSPVLPRGSCAAACRWPPQHMPAQLGRRCLAATAPPAATVSGPNHQIRGLSSTICKPFRSVPARCSGGSASSDAADNGGGPGEWGQPPPAPAGAANADGGSTAAKQIADTLPDHKTTQQQQAAEEGRPLLQEAIRLLQEAQEDMRDMHERNAMVEQKQAAVIKLLLELQQVQHDEALQQQQQQQQQQRQQEQQQTCEPVDAHIAPGQSLSGVGSTPAVPRERMTWRLLPRLMDYVYVRPYAKHGVVLGVACGSRAFKVWSLPGTTGARETFTIWELTKLSIRAECDLEPGSGRVKYLPYDPERKGVPVTRFTAAPGMLVRRNHNANTRSAAVPGEVGVIQPHVELLGEDKCLVEWSSSRTAVYGIGFNDGFELVHLETSPTSGAPVVGKFWTGVAEPAVAKVQQSPWWTGSWDDRGELLWDGRELEHPEDLMLPVNLCGMPVERGTHWTYGGAEPGLGVIQVAGTVGQEGAHIPAGFSLPVRWPNGQLLHHRACPTHGYDLCYSAQPGESVTLFTARDGLRVRMVNGGEEGVLVQPVEISPASDGVVWRVVFSGGDRDGGMELTFLVSRLYAEPTWHATEEYETASELEYI